jgi:hypothetical protein
MTGARALISVGIAGIEQRCYDPARGGLAHLGADHEVARGTLRAPVKHPIFGRVSPPGGIMSAPFSSGLTGPSMASPGNPHQPLAAP